MSRTIRAYHDRMCLRRMKNRPHKVQQAMLRDLQDDLDFPVYLGNRALFGKVPEPYDDICISALSETKQQWKHDQKARPLKRYREENN